MNSIEISMFQILIIIGAVSAGVSFLTIIISAFSYIGKVLAMRLMFKKNKGEN